MIPPRFAANLDWLYPTLAYFDRIEAARSDGFQSVEMQQPHLHERQELKARLQGLHVALINAPAGDWAAGERGFAALPEQTEAFRDTTLRGLDLAHHLGATRLHLLSGLAEDTPHSRAAWLAHLAWAAEQTPPDVTLTVEPINRRDMPGYFLHRQAQAHELLDALDAPRVKLQLDLYHCRVSEGASLPHLEAALQRNRLGHVQVASEHGRSEPRRGEFDAELRRLQDHWAGCIGLEYRPAGDTSAGLAWIDAVR